METKDFILLEYIKDITICDELIDFYKKNSDLVQEGRISKDGVNRFIDKEIKESYDLCISPENLTIEKNKCFLKYFENLKEIVKIYKKTYTYCDSYSPWALIEPINFQHYRANGGFKKWHTERTTGIGIQAKRHLVFMTYLNDVTDGGETDFFYQRIKIPPKKGLTVIWPSDWTYTHRGIPSKTQDKFIVTGWFNYTE